MSHVVGEEEKEVQSLSRMCESTVMCVFCRRLSLVGFGHPGVQKKVVWVVGDDEHEDYDVTDNHSTLRIEASDDKRDNMICVFRLVISVLKKSSLGIRCQQLRKLSKY